MSSKSYSNAVALQSAVPSGAPSDGIALSTSEPQSPIDDIAQPIEPKVLDVQFEVTQDSATEQTLWVMVPALDLRRALGRSKAPFVCGVVPSLVEPYDYDQVYLPQETRIHCGKEKSAPNAVRILEENLRLGGQVIPVGPSAKLDHRAIQQPFPPALKCGAVRPEVVHVSIRREKRKLKMAVPELGVDYLISDLNWGTEYSCQAEPPTDENDLIEVMCSHSPMSQSRFRLFVERDILFFEERDESYAPTNVLVERFGMQLPCNAQVQVDTFHAFHIPATSQCGRGCESRANACHMRCIQRDSRDECREKCGQRESACAELCMSRE